MARVVGVIRFQGLRAPLRGATVHVRVEETGRADAPATRLGEQVMQGIDVAPGDPPLPFAVEDVSAPPRGRCTVRVLVDLDGDGAVGRGDWISRQSYPVLGGGDDGPVDVTVSEVS